MTPSLSLAKLAVAGFVGDPIHPSLLVWVDPGRMPNPDMTRMKAGVAFELQWLNALLADTVTETNAPGAAFPLDGLQLAELFDVDRVLCAVGETEAGDLLALRDYEGLGPDVLAHLAEELAQITAEMRDPVLAAAALVV